MSRAFLIWAALASGLASCPGRAQETITEITTGGLLLQGPPTEGLALDGLDISIDPTLINVAYRFSYAGAAPATLTFVYSLPTLDFSDPDVAYALPSEDPVNFVDLSTQTDAVKGGFSFRQTATLEGKDVTALLRGHKLPLLPTRNFQGQVDALSAAERERLQRNKLIRQIGNNVDGKALFWPAWSTATLATRQMHIQPGQKSEITLRYKTSVGLSSDTVLRRSARTGAALQDLVREKRQRYCIEDFFLAGVDKIAPPADANVAAVKERRISFDLKNAVPVVPVREMKISVDKGRAERVVSFCLDKLVRTSPTAFEMRATDYSPDRALDILLIGRD